ncbi:MAG: 50S ribosomal protein L35 [Deltaproteobacteria bacterium]|nr:50S ribosomal protein L35 [Deltaproteobacteria bacterium]
MGKLKTHKGTQKRFKVSKTGKVKVRKAMRAHILTNKPTKQKRQARNDIVLNDSDAKRIRALLPYVGR